jgi:hypothetical protein
MGCKPVPGDRSGAERPASLISRQCAIEQGPRLTGLTDSKGSKAVGRRTQCEGQQAA